MEQHRSPNFLTGICQVAGFERSVLPPLDSKKHTKAKRLITATSSAPDRSQDGELSRNGPTATSEKRNATTVPHIHMRNRPLEREEALPQKT
jgi:cell division protein FtsN